MFDDRAFIVSILILPFAPEGPGFKLTSPASRSKTIFRLKHTFIRYLEVNFALTKIENMMCVNAW